MGIFSKITMISSRCWTGKTGYEPTYSNFWIQYDTLKDKLDILEKEESEWMTLVTHFEMYEAKLSFNESDMIMEAFYTQMRLQSLALSLKATQDEIGEKKAILKEIYSVVKGEPYTQEKQGFEALLQEEKKLEEEVEKMFDAIKLLLIEKENLEDKRKDFLALGQKLEANEVLYMQDRIQQNCVCQKRKLEELQGKLSRLQNSKTNYRDIVQEVKEELFMKEHPNETANYMIDQDRFDQYKGMATFKKGPGH